MEAAAALPVIPEGSIKTFGPVGPKYQVGPPVGPTEDGDWLVEITLVETGERTIYRLSRIHDDPEAM